jgi:hypothetical protein
MHSKQVQDEIRHLMETLNEQYTAIDNRGDLIPRIEIDLMMSTLRNMYDRMSQLSRLQDRSASEVQKDPVIEFRQSAPEPVAAHVPEIPASVPETEKQSIPVFEPEAVTEPEPVIEVKEVVTHTVSEVVESTTTETLEKINEVVFKQETIKQQQPSVRKTSQMAGLFDEVTTIAETYTVKTTLHDKMSSGKTDRSVADHLQSKPLSDLKKSIGINEKFVFVKELFEGNHQLFNTSIDKLNSFSAYEQARRHLFEDLATPLQWNTESKAFSELNDLVKRRFTS